MSNDSFLKQIFGRNREFLGTGVLLMVLGLFEICFSIIIFYYLFVKKGIPENRTLTFLINITPGFRLGGLRSSDEIANWPATPKIIGVAFSLLVGIGLFLAGSYIFVISTVSK